MATHPVKVADCLEYMCPECGAPPGEYCETVMESICGERALVYLRAHPGAVLAGDNPGPRSLEEDEET